MEVVGLVSGGKDSCFALMRCLDFGHRIVALANLIPQADDVDDLDSYMYQTVGHQVVISYAKCMGLPLFRRRIQGSSRDQRLNYSLTQGDEVEDMFILLREVKRHFPSVNAVSSGAIASDYQRLRVESVCSRLGLVSLAYLWKQDQTLLLDEMIRRGIQAIIVKVAAMGLKPAEHLGKELAELKSHLHYLSMSYGINVCGEGGEYETLTLDCPLFTNARIVLDKFQVVLHSPDSIAAVAILHPLAFHLEPKGVQISSVHDIADPVEHSFLHEVDGTMAVDTVDMQSPGLVSGTNAAEEKDFLVTKTGRMLFTVACSIRNSSSESSRSLQEDLTTVLRRIELQLQQEGLTWANVLYVHLYISSMKDFALANEVYVRFITEQRCYKGVPSRSTIELPLVHVGLGNASVEVLVADEQVKKVLHVQSISCWAPSCIGPYSQATLFREILYMAGQLGLDPPTMKLSAGSLTLELEQALQNTEAVAKSFNGSIFSSTIHFVVYCSKRLTSIEMTEVEDKMQISFLSVINSQRMLSRPTLLYILASALPRDSSIELKPILYIPVEDGVSSRVYSPPIATGHVGPTARVPQIWTTNWSPLLNSCCQVNSIAGKFCSAAVSISNDLAGKICSTMEGHVEKFSHSLEELLKATAAFCVFQIADILSKHDFSWSELTVLRVHYSTKQSTGADAMAGAFSEAFAELKKADPAYNINVNKLVFNLVPVIASGSSATMDDMITCEVFASKL